MITHYLKVTNITLNKLLKGPDGKVPYSSYGMEIDTIVKDKIKKQGYTDPETHVSLIPIDRPDQCLQNMPRFQALVASTPRPNDAVEVITTEEATTLSLLIQQEIDL